MKKFDSVIIGFGKGGKTLAAKLAKLGETVAVIEKSKLMYGGTCINIGCIPTKFLVNYAKKSFDEGGDFAQKSLRYKNVIANKKELIAKLRKANYDTLNNNPNITVIDGTASFVDSHTLNILSEDENKNEKISADKIFINTGSYSFIPPIDGLKESKYFCTSSCIMEDDTLPEHLVIIGAGYIGMEFASMYSNFGSKVTIIQDGSEFLPREDREIAQEVLESLKKKGIDILLSTETLSVQDEENCAQIKIKNNLGESCIMADRILCATGRRPQTEELNLSAAGVETTQRGAVKTDEYLKTTAENIWAMGDVTGGLQFTYISLDDSRIVYSNLCKDGKRSVNNRGVVPYSVFVDPPFSRVGISEKEAIEKGYNIKIAKISASSIPKAKILNQTTGLLKAIIDLDTDLILGVHLFCAESHEMINILKLAMDNKIPYTVIKDNIYTHPVMSESLNMLLE